MTLLYVPVVLLLVRFFLILFQHSIFLKIQLKAPPQKSAESKLNTWLKEQYIVCLETLRDHLCHESKKVQSCVFQCLTSLLKALEHSESAYDRLLKETLSNLVNSELDQKEIISCMPELLTSWEDNAPILSACLVHIKVILSNMQETPSNTFLFNCWRILRQIVDQNLDKKAKKLLTATVCSLLKYKMPTSLYREILTGIAQVMDKMSSPIRLADFLTESFSIGGAISLMSLNGLFILIHKYNLNYPDFYGKLYSMFQPQVFSAKYRARFFHLADMFLTSTHLPAYLVASFAKRLARLSLYAPVSTNYITVPFIMNLISRHPACEILLHRPDGPREFDTDPFLPEEEDLTKTKALESCLWELSTLEKHASPEVAMKARKRAISQTDLSSLLEVTTSDIIESEAKKMKKSVPVTFEKLNGLILPPNFTL